MPRPDLQPLVISDLRGGRNDTDPPMSLRPDQAVELLNVHWKDTPFAAKRGGAANVAITGGTAFSLGIQSVLRHVPGADETLAELWGIDGAATPIVKRLTGGTTWADVTMLVEGIETNPEAVVAASLNGKLFLAFNSIRDRLHVYDPNLAAVGIRRVSLNPGVTAPTVADTGGGTYAATLRYYRARFSQGTVATVLIRVSEPTPSVAFTPSGSGVAARVTRPSAPGEGETHWYIEVSTDNTTFVRLSGYTAIATTTIDDSFLPATIVAGGPVSEAIGTFALVPSCRFLISDGNRLIMLGAWEAAGTTSGGKNSRVWFTPVLGSSDKGDDERVPNQTNQKNWFDCNENDGGGFTGAGGPLNGIPYGFKYRQVWKFVPTGDVTTPYLPRKLRDDIGCIAHKSIAIGEDESGQPALYFMSHRGPYRITLNSGIQYLGRDNEVTWRSVNLGATTVVTHSTYYPALHQWWVWIATGSATVPDVKMVFDVQNGFPDEHNQVRGGWVKHDGGSAAAVCSCLMSHTLGATMSRDLKPYIGRTATTTIWKCDTSDLDDAGTAFQGRVKSKPILASGALGRKHGLEEPYVLAKAAVNVTLTLTTDRDFGKETRTHSVSLAPESGETRVIKKFEGAGVGEADVIQVEVGDLAAQAVTWTIDSLILPKTQQEWK